MNVSKLLVIAALVLAIVSLLVSGFPFLTAAVICLAAASLI